MKFNLAFAATAAALAVSPINADQTTADEVNELIQEEQNIIAQLETLDLSALAAVHRVDDPVVVDAATTTEDTTTEETTTEETTTEETGDNNTLVGTNIVIDFDAPDDNSTIMEGMTLTSSVDPEVLPVAAPELMAVTSEELTTTSGEPSDEESATAAITHESKHQRNKDLKAKHHKDVQAKHHKDDKEMSVPTHAKAIKEHSMSHPSPRQAKAGKTEQHSMPTAAKAAKHGKHSKRGKSVHSLSMDHTAAKTHKEQELSMDHTAAKTHKEQPERMSMGPTAAKAHKGEPLLDTDTAEVVSTSEETTSEETTSETESTTVPVTTAVVTETAATKENIATTEFTEAPGTEDVDAKPQVVRTPDQLPTGTDTSNLQGNKFTQEVKEVMLGGSGASSLEAGGSGAHHHQQKDGVNAFDIRDKSRANVNGLTESDMNGSSSMRYGVLGGLCLAVSSIVYSMMV